MKKFFILVVLMFSGLTGLLTACAANEEPSSDEGTTPAVVTGDHADPDRTAGNRD